MKTLNQMMFSSLLLVLLPSPFAIAQIKAVDLGTLGGRTSIARDINSQGVIVGESETAALDTHAFVWKEGVMTDLGVLNGKYSMANGLNNRGQIVGYAAYRGGGAGVGTDAVLWDEGKIIKLPSYKSASFSQASELNDKEEIVGVSGANAVVWRNRIPSPLPSLGGSYAIALGINEKGWIIGNSATPSEETHATLWKEGIPIDLGTLGGRFSNANGISEEGVVVGSSETANGSIHGFIWFNGVMRDLGPGMPRSINSRGWIAGEKNPDLSRGVDPVAFLNDDRGQAIKLELVGGGAYSSGFAVNDLFMAVGVRAIKDAEGYTRFRATLWH